MGQFGKVENISKKFSDIIRDCKLFPSLQKGQDFDFKKLLKILLLKNF